MLVNTKPKDQLPSALVADGRVRPLSIHNHFMARTKMKTWCKKDAPATHTVSSDVLRRALCPHGHRARRHNGAREIQALLWLLLLGVERCCTKAGLCDR